MTVTRLRVRMASLEKNSRAYKPYNADPEAPVIPPILAQDLMTTLDSTNDYERRLAKNKLEQAHMRNQFELDIVRFRELKRMQYRNRSVKENTNIQPETLTEVPDESATPET